VLGLLPVPAGVGRLAGIEPGVIGGLLGALAVLRERGQVLLREILVEADEIGLAVPVADDPLLVGRGDAGQPLAAEGGVEVFLEREQIGSRAGIQVFVYLAAPAGAARARTRSATGMLTMMQRS